MYSKVDMVAVQISLVKPVVEIPRDVVTRYLDAVDMKDQYPQYKKGSGALLYVLKKICL